MQHHSLFGNLTPLFAWCIYIPSNAQLSGWDQWYDAFLWLRRGKVSSKGPNSLHYGQDEHLHWKDLSEWKVYELQSNLGAPGCFFLHHFQQFLNEKEIPVCYNLSSKYKVAVVQNEYGSNLPRNEHCLSSSEDKAWKKIQACKGFEPTTSAIPEQCSINQANKPTGSWSLYWFQIIQWSDE